jgi:undecaprenyl-diphosphatase
MIDTGTAVLLGVVQGLTEFLPVSSDGHLTLFQAGLGLDGPALALDVALHVGTLLAMVLFFRADIARLGAGLVGRGDANRAVDRRALVLILIATVVTGGIGLSLKPWVERVTASYGAAAIGFFLTTLVLLRGERAGKRPARVADPAAAPLWHALVIGAAQGLAVWPGLSRSASTISVALVLGWAWPAAGRFSFLAAIPAIAGATLLTARDMTALPVGPTVAGLAASFLVGWAALALLMKFLAARRLWPFALYTMGMCFFALFKSVE